MTADLKGQIDVTIGKTGKILSSIEMFLLDLEEALEERGAQSEQLCLSFPHPEKQNTQHSREYVHSEGNGGFISCSPGSGWRIEDDKATGHEGTVRFPRSRKYTAVMYRTYLPCVWEGILLMTQKHACLLYSCSVYVYHAGCGLTRK